MAADLGARVTQLEATVRELQDREAIRELRYRYHEYVNESKGNDIPGLFTDDGELDFGHLGKAKGKEQLQKFFRALDASEPPRTARASPGSSSSFTITRSILTATPAPALPISKRSPSTTVRPSWLLRVTTTSTSGETASGNSAR